MINDVIIPVICTDCDSVFDLKPLLRIGDLLDVPSLRNAFRRIFGCDRILCGNCSFEILLFSY